jgi:hypothetical protein
MTWPPVSCTMGPTMPTFETPLDRIIRGLRWLWRKLTGADAPKTLYKHFIAYFGHDLLRLQTHEKQFPGYDIASLHRALTSLFDECCTERHDVGSCHAWTTRNLLDSFKNIHGRWMKPGQPTDQRVAVDVEEEISVVTSSLYFAELKPDAGMHRTRKTAALRPEEQPGPAGTLPEKMAVLLTVHGAADYWDGMETNHVPVQRVSVSVACSTRDAADRFFSEVEQRRRRLSIYRGKVIDPALHGGVIHAIGFRAIKQVREGDLVLPDAVKRLIERSVVGFCSHGPLLERLGIELKRGVLLHGAPGTGKTSISLYLAGLLPHFTVCFVSGERLLYPREICQMARYLQPAMIVFEDIDLIAQQRDANGLATVLGELMNQIDGCEPTDQVLFVMNTNSLDRLEGAVRNRPGRVDQIVEIPLPDRDARRQLLDAFSRNVRVGANLDEVVDATRDMSPAMLKEIVKRAVVMAVERDGAGEVTVEQGDLMLAAAQVQAMREPLVPGSMGFRTVLAESEPNHDRVRAT